MRGKKKPIISERNSRANMAKIKAKKPQSGPLEKAPAAAVIRARVRARKPYLYVPEDVRIPSNLPDPPPPVSEENSEEQPLPKAEKLFKNHLYNQSRFNGW